MTEKDQRCHRRHERGKTEAGPRAAMIAGNEEATTPASSGSPAARPRRRHRARKPACGGVLACKGRRRCLGLFRTPVRGRPAAAAAHHHMVSRTSMPTRPATDWSTTCCLTAGSGRAAKLPAMAAKPGRHRGGRAQQPVHRNASAARRCRRRRVTPAAGVGRSATAPATCRRPGQPVPPRASRPARYRGSAVAANGPESAGAVRDDRHGASDATPGSVAVQAIEPRRPQRWRPCPAPAGAAGSRGSAGRGGWPSGAAAADPGS